MERAGAVLGLLWAAVLAAAVGLRAAGAEPAGTLRLTVELDDLEELAQRVQLRLPGWRFLLIDRRRGGEAVYRAVGLSGPLLAVGPLAPRGLLREAANPLGFLPGSGALEERSGYRLEGSLAGTLRRGLWLEPLPGALGLFAVQRRPRATAASGPLQAGGVLRLRLSPAVEAEALVTAARPAGEGSPAASGALAHVGARLGLQPPLGKAGLALQLGGAASGGERLRPGGFLRLQLRLEGRTVVARALVGVCSPGYRTPSGEPVPDASQLAVRVEVGPFAGWRLAGSWNWRVGRAGLPAGRFLPAEEEASLFASWERGTTGSRRLRVQARVDGSLRCDGDGRRNASLRGGIEASMRTAGAEAGLELGGGWEQGLEASLRRAALFGQVGGLRLEAGLSADGARLLPHGRAELARGTTLLWVEARGGADRRWRLSLGWTAAQPLSKSPTRRISRSS